MIQFIRLLGRDAQPFAPMTNSAISSQLEDLQMDSPVVAIGMIQDRVPAGLAIGALQGDRAAELSSVFVAEKLWNKGHGTRLLALMEQSLRDRGCSVVHASWVTHGACTPAFQRVLEKCVWSPPETRLHLATIDPVISQKSEWIQRLRVPAEYQVFPWSELTTADQDQLESLRETIPVALYPLVVESAPVEPICSLGIRKAADIVGWIICHRVAERLIRYTMLYVREPWRSSELSFALLAEAIRRKQAHYAPDVLSTLAVEAANTPMLRILERKLKPFALSWSEMRASCKRL